MRDLGNLHRPQLSQVIFQRFYCSKLNKEHSQGSEVNDFNKRLKLRRREIYAKEKFICDGLSVVLVLVLIVQDRPCFWILTRPSGPLDIIRARFIGFLQINRLI